MADFEFLENIAIRIKDNRQKLFQIEEGLSDTNFKIHEIPLKRSTESTFAKMIGVGYDDKVAELEKIKESLEKQKEELKSSVESDMATFITEISSPELVIPLEPTPTVKEGKTIYKYRNGAKFKNVFDILSELLGLSSPLVVKDVLLSSSEIVIAVPNEFEAKQKFISSMSEVQNTLLIKKRR